MRIEGGQVLATLIRLTRDIDLAEDALQDASIEALRAWTEGVPDNPGAWLTTVARRKALDRVRREARRRDKESEAARLVDDDPPPGDDRLRLLFTCCHPALAPEARVALTLRTIGGLTTPEIARVFLVSDATMGQRISRSKAKIRKAAIPYRIPADHELPERLPAVLAVVYLVFTTGHHAPSGAQLERVDLADEAMRLGRMLADLMPDEPEVHGLLALMAATHARTPARTDDAGRPVLLAEQDRSRWDADLVAEATRHLSRAERNGVLGPYGAQATIACLHAAAPSWEATDWAAIVEVYRALDGSARSVAVTVNRAVAESMVAGPEAGLAGLADLDGGDHWHLRWSTEASFLAELGRTGEAIAAYDRALACEMNDDDRRLLEARRNALVGGRSGPT